MMKPSPVKPAPGRPAPRPRLRCPACGSEVVLPASLCPHCGADLRTAYLQRKRTGPSLRARVLIVAQLCLLVVGASWLARRIPWRGGEMAAPAPAAGLSAGARREAIAAAPADFKILAEKNPLLLLPYIYVYRARTAAQRQEAQIRSRYGQLEDLDELMPDLLAFRRATPAQRSAMLEDLFNQTQP